MPLPNPKQRSKGGTFTQIGEEPLSKHVIGVRLPESVYKIVYNLPDRTEWLRRVIVEAAKQELMNDSSIPENLVLENSVPENSVPENNESKTNE